MAIKDIQQQLIKSEGQSGEFLIKKIKADLDEVYKRGYGERTTLLDSYWDQALKEFSDEASRAVKKGKSKEAKEVLKDLETFQKSLEATAEISDSGIGAGTYAMLQAVKPHILTRAKTLSKNEGIFKSMKKKAIGSAVGVVEDFASAMLAPLPFGMGSAIIEKSKGFLGAGKGDKAERQAEQAVSFAGRIEREGEVADIGEPSGPDAWGRTGATGAAWSAGGGGAGGGDGSGGQVVIEKLDNIATLLTQGFGLNSPPFLQTMNEKLDDLIGVSKPDRETAREEEREDDREHKALLDALKKKGGVGAAGLDGEDGGGFLSSLLGSFLGTSGIPGVGGFFGGKGGKGTKLNKAGRLIDTKTSQFVKGGGKGLNPANLLKGPAFKTALSAMTIPLMGAITPMLAFLVSPPGLIALAVAATAGGLWWAGSKLLEEKSSEEISETLEKVRSTPAIHGGRVTKKQAEKMKAAREKSLEEDLVEAKERESGEGKKGKWVWEGLGRQKKRVWVPSGQEGANFMDINPKESFLATLHGGEEVIEAKEVLALQRVTELAKTLIEQFGKGGEYWIKHEGARYNVKGDTKTGEGAALQAVKLMAKLGATNFEHIFQREKDVYGKMKIDHTSGQVQGRQRQEVFNLMKDTMPGLIQQFGDIKSAKLQLADMETSGYRIPFEAAKFNTAGKGLNNAAYDKIGSEVGKGVINVSAPTINAPTSNNTITSKRLPSPYGRDPYKMGEDQFRS